MSAPCAAGSAATMPVMRQVSRASSAASAALRSVPSTPGSAFVAARAGGVAGDRGNGLRPLRLDARVLQGFGGGQGIERGCHARKLIRPPPAARRRARAAAFGFQANSKSNFHSAWNRLECPP